MRAVLPREKPLAAQLELSEVMARARSAADPFEAFDWGMGMYSVRDPYPRFAELRRRGPIHRVDLSKWFPPFMAPGEDPHGWAIMSWTLASRVLRDAAGFSSAKYARTAEAVMGKNLLSTDPPEHTRYRELVAQAFTPRAMALWEMQVVRPVIRGLLDGLAPRGRADLAREFSFRFPVEVIARLFGLPEDDRKDFHRWGVELQCVLFDFERGVRAARDLTEYFLPVIEAHRRQPREDLLSGLVAAELGGERLSNEEILGFMRLLLPAGLETTYRSAGNMLCALLTHPAQLEAVRARRGLLDAAVEESLRWEAPLTGGLRVATRDAELAGTQVAAGDKVYVCWGAANRDESRWPDAERFDIQREHKPHLAFGFGPHRCLGMHLARMEMRVALDLVLDCLPGLRLDPAARDVHITGEGFRSPATLPAIWDA
jgi:cytochrome P450